MTRFLELSHPLEPGMKAYPGLPDPVFTAYFDHAASRQRYGGKSEFYIGWLEMPGNVGTYIDAPFHRYPDGEDLGQVPLDRVAGLPGLVLDATIGTDRSAEVRFDPAEIGGTAVLIRTGWDQRWGTDRYWQPGPFLAPDLVERIVASRPALVGVDFSNVDDTQDLARPAHTRLLGAGILIVEHLCGLGPLPRSGFRFSAVPLRLVRGASLPVRAYAELPPASLYVAHAGRSGQESLGTEDTR